MTDLPWLRLLPFQPSLRKPIHRPWPLLQLKLADVHVVVGEKEPVELFEGVRDIPSPPSLVACLPIPTEMHKHGCPWLYLIK